MPAKRSDALREQLEEDILTGALRPGDRLDEMTLADRFGVSRTPIREALFHLAAAGLIDNRPKRGAVVAEIGPRQLVEMFEVMAELEGMCARLAARRATPEDHRAMRAAHEACHDAEVQKDADGYYYENETFHESVRAASHNRFLAQQASALHKRLRPYRRLQLRTKNRIEVSFSEHGEVLTAIENGDPVRAEDQMRRHIVIQGERFTDLLVNLEAYSANG